jgi:hypothetical protein
VAAALSVLDAAAVERGETPGPQPAERRIPVTVLSGFLGSGGLVREEGGGGARWSGNGAWGVGVLCCDANEWCYENQATVQVVMPDCSTTWDADK